VENNRAKGTLGEKLAAKYLRDNGFEILVQNYSPKANFQGGEIDIIARKGDRIHFVEVKSRSTDRFGMGREAVTVQKQKVIRKLAARYLVERGLYDTASCCFDVIEINGDRVEYFFNCF